MVAGCYSLSSVAYVQSGTDSYSQTSGDTSCAVGTQSQYLTGTYNALVTQSLSGANFGDTIAFGWTVTGTETSTSQSAATLSGGDTWSATLLGSYSGDSYSFSSVVYQGTQTQSLTDYNAGTTQFSGANTKSAGESQATIASATMAVSNTNNSQNTVTLTDQDTSSAYQSTSDDYGSTYSWYYAGSYGGSDYTFTSYNETVSLTDNSNAVASLSSTETVGFTANVSSSSTLSSSGTLAADAYSNQNTSYSGGTITFTTQNSGSGTFSLSGYVSYTQGELGSYGGGNYTLSDWSYDGTQNGTYTSQVTQSMQQTLTATGTTGYSSAGSYSSSLLSYNSMNSMQGGTTITVSNANSNGDTTTFNGTISVGDTLTVSETGTYGITATQDGSYSGGSFSYDSMTYNVVTTQALSKTEYSGYTVTDLTTITDASANTHTGANTADSSNGSYSDSGTGQDTITSYTTATSQDNSTYSLYEAGSYGGQSWSLPSFNLLQSDRATSSSANSVTHLILASGSFTQSSYQGGTEQYNVSGSFLRSGGTTTIVQSYSGSGYTISEQGTFANASLGLSSFAFAYADSSQQTTTASGDATDTTAGTDDVGLGASNPTFTGGGAETISYEDDQSSSDTLDQQGVFSGGSFNLSEVDYSGASADSYNSGDSAASLWTGSYAGSQTATSAVSSSDSESMSATGNYAGGSWSLSNYARCPAHHSCPMRTAISGSKASLRRWAAAAASPAATPRGDEFAVPIGHRDGGQLRQQQLQLPGRIRRDDGRGRAGRFVNDQRYLDAAERDDGNAGRHAAAGGDGELHLPGARRQRQRQQQRLDDGGAGGIDAGGAVRHARRDRGRRAERRATGRHPRGPATWGERANAGWDGAGADQRQPPAGDGYEQLGQEHARRVARGGDDAGPPGDPARRQGRGERGVAGGGAARRQHELRRDGLLDGAAAGDADGLVASGEQHRRGAGVAAVAGRPGQCGGGRVLSHGAAGALFVDEQRPAGALCGQHAIQ